MARIVVITHAFDRFGAGDAGYMLAGVLHELQRRGHSWRVAAGAQEAASGDAAILHVDATRVAEPYVDYGRRFPVCLNLAVTDIGKRRLSDARVTPGDRWTGPVIVKSDLNHRGIPEQRLNRRARLALRRAPFPGARTVTAYEIFPAIGAVPAALIDDPHLVIERFLPEPSDGGYAIRHWIFCGDYDFCGRFTATEPLVKGADIFRSEPAEVPRELRRRREALGLDYGKIDYVMHDGEVVVLDYNKTPGLIPAVGYVASLAGLADGFEGMIDGRRQAPQRWGDTVATG